MTRALQVVKTKPRRVSIARLRQAVRLFRSDYVSKEVNKANRRNWLRSVERLGDKWLLASPINTNRSN